MKHVMQWLEEGVEERGRESQIDTLRKLATGAGVSSEDVNMLSPEQALSIGEDLGVESLRVQSVADSISDPISSFFEAADEIRALMCVQNLKSDEIERLIGCAELAVRDLLLQSDGSGEFDMNTLPPEVLKEIGELKEAQTPLDSNKKATQETKLG